MQCDLIPYPGKSASSVSNLILFAHPVTCNPGGHQCPQHQGRHEDGFGGESTTQIIYSAMLWFDCRATHLSDRLATQLEGAQTPGSSVAVAATTVRGSKSFGMICSAYDLGWMEEANGFAVELPLESEPGEPLENHPPKVPLHASQKSVTDQPRLFMI